MQREAQISGLPIPLRIVELIESGRWKMPTEAEILSRFSSSFAPPDEAIGPRFYSVDEMRRETEYWLQIIRSRRETVLNSQIVSFPPEQLILTGDVGTGLDSPIALDCSRSSTSPRAIHLIRAANIAEWKTIEIDVERFSVRLRL